MPELSARLREACESGAVIVAASRLLASEIERNYALHQSAHGTRAWAAPDVSSWDQWLRHLGEKVLWSGYSSPSGRRRLLTPVQEQLLWERIIGGSKTTPTLLNVHATAKMAREAWAIIQQWRLADPGTVGFPTAEQQAFSRWMQHYHRESADNAWLDGARVIDSLVPAISSGAVPVPEHIVLVGFDKFTPQQRALLRALASMGSRLGRIQEEAGPGVASRVALPDHEVELGTAARWLRSLVAAGSGKRVGLAVPGLDAACAQIERTLDEALLPGHSLPGTDREVDRPYMIGAGRALRKQPVVVAADHLLALSMGSVSMRVLGRVIRSPFLDGGISEATRRARFDAWIRDQGSVDIDVGHLPGMLESFRHATGLASDDFILEQRIATMLAERDAGEARGPSEWAKYFRSLLTLFGWPGESRLDAIQQQARSDFDDMLREFSGLGIVTGEMTAAEALRLLRQLLRQRMFRFEAPDMPILVLSPQDAARIRFDHLWVCAIDRDDWAGLERQPNPLIPLEWHQQCASPASSPQARSKYRSQLAEKLCHAGARVVVSHSSDSDRSLHAVFGAVGPGTVGDLELAELTDYRQALVASTDMEFVEDTRGPKLEPVELLDLDQDVLALQAACPFRAFARKRLDALRPKSLRPGLLPEARVTLLRMALEHLWHRIESQDVLQAALSGEHLEVQIWEIADTVLAVFERKLPVRLSRRYRALEHARLVRLLLQWLRVETARAPFTVLQTDAHATIEMGGISFRAQVDRMDQVDGKGLAIIAYDTEEFGLEHWLGDRPDSPVLILYALSTDQTPAALLTGCVSAERMSLRGVQHQAGVVRNLPVYEKSDLARATGLSWEGLLANWRTTLTGLSREFAGGEASVNPKYGAATCATCNLSSLCRVGERVAV